MVRRKKVISENACGRTIFRENSKKNIFFAKRACKNEINVVLYLSRRKTGTEYGSVVQLVRTLACHARGHGFESRPSRHSCLQYASVAQLVEQRTENPRVVGSIPTGGTITKQSAHVPIVWYSPFFASISCGFSSFGRAPPCQGGGGGFEPRNPLHFFGAIAKR